MTYVVTENCIKCKYMDCVEVCPVDCFYEGENMLVIHPDECIDCGVCEPECPAEAIKPDAEPGLEQWLKLNADMAKSWPNITIKKDAPGDAKEFGVSWTNFMPRSAPMLTLLRFSIAPSPATGAAPCDDARLLVVSDADVRTLQGEPGRRASSH